MYKHMKKNINFLKRYFLSRSDKQLISEIIDKVDNTNYPMNTPEMVREVALHSGYMPLELRKIMYDLRNVQSEYSSVLVKGYEVDDEKIGPTPKHWRTMNWEPASIRRENIYQGLVTCMAGDVIGWELQENGRFYRNVVPVEVQKDDHLGEGSSAADLTPHTEEAHSLVRPDFLSLFCFRNFEKAATTLCAIDDLRLPERLVKILSQPRFLIIPHKDYFYDWKADENVEVTATEVNTEYRKLYEGKFIPILTGNPNYPYVQFDHPVNLTYPEGDVEAKAAAQEFYDIVNNNLEDVPLESGDLLVLDNFRTLHGRSIFTPKYDGKDRWLVRIELTSDLRKSVHLKEQKTSRLIREKF